MSESLLPFNATALEVALEATFAVPVPLPNDRLWNPETCPDDLLPWLAHAMSVDFWNNTWPAATKRRVIRDSVVIHRKKGTISSIRMALAAAGFPQARLFEDYGTPYNGSVFYDGSILHEGADHWAEYRVYIDRPITIAQAAEVRAIIEGNAPARCHLLGIFFVEAANIYDAAIVYDGVFSHGAA